MEAGNEDLGLLDRSSSSGDTKSRSSSVGIFARLSLCLIDWTGVEVFACLRGGMAALPAFAANDLGQVGLARP